MSGGSAVVAVDNGNLRKERKAALKCTPDGIVTSSFGHFEFEVLVGHPAVD